MEQGWVEFLAGATKNFEVRAAAVTLEVVATGQLGIEE